MSGADQVRTIESVKAVAPSFLQLRWSDGMQARVDVARLSPLRRRKQRELPAKFAAVRVGEWGHSVEWPGGAEISAETLWLETLSAIGRDDARIFLEWRLRHGLSLTKAAEALGLSRRTVAYYSNGDRPVPRTVLLACKGFEAEQAA